jgi:hypothetical protein
MSARKAAPSDQSNAKIAGEQFKVEQRIDAMPDRLPTSRETIRAALAARRKMSPEQRAELCMSDDYRATVLLERATDASWLELRGDKWDAEDRKDAASDALTRVLIDFSPAVPVPSARRAQLSVFCGHVANWRAARLSDRERDHADYLERCLERDTDGFTLAEREAIEDGRMMAANDRENAERALANVCDRLDVVNEPSPITDALYSWLRDADGDVCRAERPTDIGAIYSAGSWRVRVSKGGSLLRAAVPNALALLDALLPAESEILADGKQLTFSLTDQSREAGGHASTWAGSAMREIAADWREGTNAGNRPVRPVDPQAARDLCQTSYMPAAPKRAEQNRDKLRRDHRSSVSNGREQRKVLIPALSDEQRRVNALRSIARASAQGRRERGVNTGAERQSERSKRAA